MTMCLPRRRPRPCHQYPGLDQPAAILQETDRGMRAMLQECELPRAIATNLDAGLVFVDLKRSTLRFADIKINLY